MAETKTNRSRMIGANIKKHRMDMGVSRSDLAKDLGRDESYIASIEDQSVLPQASELLKIAKILKTDMSALVYGREFGAKQATLVRSRQRVRIERTRAFEYESLAPYYAGRHIEPFIVELRSSAEREYSSHAGEEFHFLLEGKVRTVVGSEEYLLEPGDSLYFDSSLPHALSALTERAKLLAAIYIGETMLQKTRGKRMRDMVHAAKMTGGRNLAVVCPDEATMDAVNRAIEEGIVRTAWLFGDLSSLPESCMRYAESYRKVDAAGSPVAVEKGAAREAVACVAKGDCQMLMKGKINTAEFVKAMLDKKSGIGTGRRLSLVSIFELPDLDRLIFLTDPGINPELFPGDDVKASVDIVTNAIGVARSMGVACPRVALLEANEVPSRSIPTTLYESRLSQMKWENAVVDGPVSYDLALYQEAAVKKGVKPSPVIGRADILVVPFISGGNFLYKAWTKTMAAEVANVVIGAIAPVILTSRSDSDMVKFLSMCACVLYSQHIAGES